MAVLDKIKEADEYMETWQTKENSNSENQYLYIKVHTYTQ